MNSILGFIAVVNTLSMAASARKLITIQTLPMAYENAHQPSRYAQIASVTTALNHRVEMMMRRTVNLSAVSALAPTPGIVSEPAREAAFPRAVSQPLVTIHHFWHNRMRWMEATGFGWG